MCKQKGVVYKIPCNDCGARYIGETLRTVDERTKEHRRATQKGDVLSSAVAELARLNDHAIAWDSAVAVDRESGTSRKIKEALHIVMEKVKGPLMNKDDGSRSAMCGKD